MRYPTAVIVACAAAFAAGPAFAEPEERPPSGSHGAATPHIAAIGWGSPEEDEDRRRGFVPGPAQEARLPNTLPGTSASGLISWGSPEEDEERRHRFVFAPT